ncbi:MFS transporter [Aurantiacibacter zhengii]|uniref:MFS transporter n=1 Tax=Aurantiacibacter zhengii TaxID=2307003 RepID=A0A418NXD4_9SPHN|nr:MFS transporter [Aurantiacibacter zhengii]RIV89255.1 MFS transporter [Aurantiacibacter zhengii]
MQPDGRLILAQSGSLRLFTLFILYVAQGVPIGLFWFAIPAWMATNGADASDIGYVLGLTALPWTLKLVNGFIMDRYTFLPMGRRRAWIAGAQCVMIALLIACAVMRPDVDDILLLGIAGFVVNMATTFQDVAVDGLAVDIMEEEERARASGMMFGGQSIGIAMATGLTGVAIANFGPSAAYALAACFIALITAHILLLRERDGERRLPWSEGRTHPRNAEIHLGAWWPIITNTAKSLLLPVSLLWLPILLVRGFHMGMFTAITPVLGAGEVGWDEAAITGAVGTAQLVAGILGLSLGGWVGDRFGAKKATIGYFIIFMALSTLMLAAQSIWSDPSLYYVFVFGWVVFDILLTVAALPISMRLCHPSVAATQFTLYMACSNFGISIGAWVFGLSGSLGGLPGMFIIVLGLHGIGLLLMLVVKFPRRAGAPREIVAEVAEAPGPRAPVS